MDRSGIPLPLNEHIFLCVVLSSTFNGAYVGLAAITIYKLHGMAHLPKRTSWLLTSICVVNLLFYTLLSISVAFLLHDLLFSPSRLAKSWLIPAIFLCPSTVFTVGDGLLIYRFWVIWGYPRWIWFPILLFVGEFASFLFSFFTSLARGTEAAAGVVGLWDAPVAMKASAQTAIALTVSLNTALATAAIARLMLARRALRSHVLPGGGAHYVRISCVLALSAVIYGTSWLPILFSRPAGHALIYYVVLFAVVASMPLVVMLQAGGDTRQQTFVLPVIEESPGEI